MISTYFLTAALVLVSITCLYILIKNLGHVEILKHYESVLPHLQNEVKEKEDQMDLLFVQLLQWRELSEEYRNLIVTMLPATKNKVPTDAFQNLGEKFKHLYGITETDRKKYMAQLMQKSDYTEEFNKVVDHIVDKLTNVDTGIKSDDNTLLN